MSLEKTLEGAASESITIEFWWNVEGSRADLGGKEHEGIT